MIRRFSIGYDVQLHKRTRERALVSLIGPDSETIAGAAELPDAEHSHLQLRIAGIAARAIRTDTGVDLLCEASDSAALIAALQDAGAVPVSDSAVECLRVEHGRPLYGVDLDDTVIP